MAKAYKCDICQKYCDDVWTIHGLSEPVSHNNNIPAFQTATDCCEDCYNKICQLAYDMVIKYQVNPRHKIKDL